MCGGGGERGLQGEEETECLYVREHWEAAASGACASPASSAHDGAGVCAERSSSSPPLSPQQVEAALGVEGDDILYVGDHIYTDAALAKINFRCVGGWVVGSVVCVWVGGG